MVADLSFHVKYFVSYSLDKMVANRITYIKKFVHLQIGLSKCQQLRALDPI